MEDAGKAIRRFHSSLRRQQQQHERERARTQRLIRRYRFVWAEGLNTLYKFKSMAGNSCSEVEDIIENSRIYLSMVDQFNDPFDCAPVNKPAKPLTPAFIEELQADAERLLAESGKTPEEIVETNKQQVSVVQLWSEITADTRRQMRENTRIFCLTARQDHPLQWAHYADSHRGVCLHFNCNSGSFAGMARRVVYRKDRAPILFPFHYNPSADVVVDRMVLTKADFWKYESEYRVIRHMSGDWSYKSDGRFSHFPPDELTGITLGLNMRPIDRHSAMNWAARHVPALAVYEAIEDHDRFGLEIRRIR